MKFKKIRPTFGEVYEIAFDDKCLVIKAGDNKVWISKSMAQWIALNFANKTDIKIVFV